MKYKLIFLLIYAVKLVATVHNWSHTSVLGAAYPLIHKQ